MIQDIDPERLDNAFRDIRPTGSDRILYFEKDRILVSYDSSGGRLAFPTLREFNEGTECTYAFSVSEIPYFLALETGGAPQAYEMYSLQEIRNLKLSGNADIFSAYTAYHLWKWYASSVFCGACGNRTVFDHEERAKVCPECGNRIYPRINPAVIVGVTDGEKLLLTKYRSGFRHNALIAGFTEIGETAEQTVRREVMEETGLRVKNIRYYKSQPWGIASDLLMGFYCDVDGDTTIHRDEKELGYAEWVPRNEIILQPSDYSLTNEMMKMFRDGKR